MPMSDPSRINAAWNGGEAQMIADEIRALTKPGAYTKRTGDDLYIDPRVLLALADRVAELEAELKRVAQHLRQNQVDLPPEFAKVLRENYWELLSNGHSPDSVRSAQPSGEQACEGARASGESPAQSAPAQEPVAFMFIVRYSGKGKLSEFAAIDYTEQPGEEIIARKPLFYAAPQQNEAVALLSEAHPWLGAYADAEPLYERILAYLEQHK